jgi:Tfp pilus assembly protein PilV
MAPRRRWVGQRAAAGAALLEALVALAVAGVALLFLVGLLAHEARLASRAAAQTEALAALEGVLAGVRAGAIPLADATWEAPEPPWVPLPRRRRAALWLEVRPAGVADLWDVTVTVRYTAWNEVQTRALATRVWRPR